ncbi:ribonuclease H-like domain-containing protein [Russula brevipes]|nr:ribonuclease H-like domain-containing protein [Russula brevipes]
MARSASTPPSPNARCGSGIWQEPNHVRNTAIRVPGEKHSNQIGEIAAVLAAIASVPIFYPLTILTDSRYVIDGLTSNLHRWEDDSWIGIDNADLFKRAAFLLKHRIATTDFQWVKGHSRIPGNVESDKLAKAGANKPDPDLLDLTIPPTSHTLRTLQLTRDALTNYNGAIETDQAIWKGTQKHTLRTRIKQFLYKSIHGSHKIGEFWANIPGLEHRQNCSTCGTTETLTHILTQCGATPTELIWSLAKDTWPHAPQLWPEINLGIILGSGSITLPPDIEPPPDDPQQRPRSPSGHTRLLTILISESAHLIWVLRCERAIQGRTHSPNEIHNRWLRAINIRLTDDRIVATVLKRDQTSIRRMKHTWEHVLRKQRDLPADWINHREVLVGRRTL